MASPANPAQTPTPTSSNYQPLRGSCRRHVKHPRGLLVFVALCGLVAPASQRHHGEPRPLLTFMSSLMTQVPQQHPPPCQQLTRLQQSRMQLLLQLRFGWQFGPVLGHGDAVFVYLQKPHLFVAGLGTQDEAKGTRRA